MYIVKFNLYDTILQCIVNTYPSVKHIFEFKRYEKEHQELKIEKPLNCLNLTKLTRYI